MSAGEQSDERELDSVLLPFECPFDGLSQALESRKLLGDQRGRSGHGTETSMARTGSREALFARVSAAALRRRDFSKGGRNVDVGGRLGGR